MAGNTGRMTKAEILRRGPRFVLACLLGSGELVTYHEGNHPKVAYSVLAKSYSLGYLDRIKKANNVARQETNHE